MSQCCAPSLSVLFASTDVLPAASPIQWTQLDGGNGHYYDVIIDELDAMQATGVEGVLYMTQNDYDAFNLAGGGLLAAWNAEAGSLAMTMVAAGRIGKRNQS